MIFADRNRRTGRKHQNRKRQSDRDHLQGRQYAQLADMNKQRLKGYAESFRELAGSLQEEWDMQSYPEGWDVQSHPEGWDMQSYPEGWDVQSHPEGWDKQSHPEERNRQRILEARKRWENRQLIGNNLCEVASIMERVADRELCYEPVEEKKLRILVHALRAEGLYAETLCYLPNENGNRALGMVLYTEKKGGIASDEVAKMLSVLLQSRLEPAATSPYTVDRQHRTFLFVEEARFLALTGMAKIVKDRETVSGDNYAVLQSDTGKKTVLLSDGTGSGRRANADSGRVLDLLEKMLEAGFELGAAVTMVNTAMFAKGEERNHPTLDVCSLDLYSGECEICKIGGAVSFLKRGKHVDIISQGTLPLGIFQNITVQILRRQLQDGDYLVLMTDGVLDALQASEASEGNDCEEAMSDTICNMPERNPQEMAEKLLQLVLKNCGGHIPDDMTILVVGIWEN